MCPRDQIALSLLGTEINPGVVLCDKYEPISILGMGAMGTVYKVRNKHSNNFAALKIIDSRFMGDTEFIKCFWTDATVARQLNHPNVLRIDDVDYTDHGRPFIVTGLVDGHSLWQLKHENPRPWPVQSCIDIAIQIAQALEAANALGIIHRGIRPSKILRLNSSRSKLEVKVKDFGMSASRYASFAAMKATLSGSIFMYLSPEQLTGAPDSSIDGRSDLYSLSLVLYELLTGTYPFHADTGTERMIRQINMAPMRLDSIVRGIPPEFGALVMKALQKDPANRIQSPTEMLTALRGLPRSHT